MKPIKFHPLKILVPPKNVKFYVDSHCTTPEARGRQKNKKNKKLNFSKFSKDAVGGSLGWGAGGQGGGWGVMGGAWGRPGALIFDGF